MSALVVKNLNCFYQENKILKNLDINLQDNEIVCLLGESGCGKTTLLRVVAGLQPDTTGDITINGNVVDSDNVNVAPEKRKVGLIFQDYALFPHLNVFDNVAFSLTKMSKEEKKKSVEEVLALVQLSDYSERFPHQLSGGQQQRIAIARALAYQPELMLLDEPFSNLDQHVRFQLIKDIRLLLKKRAMSALFVTHSKEEGFAFADKIALMQSGKIIQIGVPQQLYNAPESRYVADFMGKSNYVEVQVAGPNSYQSAFGLLNSETVIEAPKGTTLQLLIRPEQLTLTVCEYGPANIIEIDFLGAFQQLTVSFKNKNYLVKQNNQQAGYQVGDKAELIITDHSFVLFS
ncbi:ABC transporter ATP-binding protein [Psychromonas sp. Urea-02u-13]|uniref:ABC transporter ATP-binding protein n=1 Tax=Psychromonas sp. Urea-02u-13 TaxID=2058326 RepID=UPI000C33474E|nr:ABC transporter ATP-binding protein [Psychromonas sp. Urea-02u-13]PKG39903.1 ABC transporter [Psychromonas sp. Urea-02u-13]